MIAFKKKTAIMQIVSAVLFDVMHSFVIDFFNLSQHCDCIKYEEKYKVSQQRR